jgi:NAD(P)H dehydrogenase (quinone)
MSAHVAVIYYSMRGHTHGLAVAVAEGAEEAGAEVRLRRVPELAPPEVVASIPEWQATREATADIPEAVPDDLVWADGIAFGSPTRFGGPAAQLRQFIDTLGPLWLAGALADKVGTSFTSAKTPHGGQESTILALNNVFYHWGCAIVSLGFHHPVVRSQTGNPYGASAITEGDEEGPTEADLTVARWQGSRLAQWAAARPAAGSGVEEVENVG